MTYNVYQTKNNNKLAAKCMFTLKRGEILSNSMLTLWASSHANLGAKTHKQICSTIVPTVVKSSAAAATTTITFPSTYNL
ncbi:MAG: hypothetical protein ACD_29C00328G0004 [uncultured bacterium]|nr:MAG: hypothetical protein ACD_29C00328G0004 [uncultured bacterium]